MTQPTGATALPSSLLAAGDDPDAALFDRLVQDRFRGPLYNQVEDRLAAYGIQVLRAWIRRGDIFGRCFRMGIRGLPPSTDWSAWSEEDIDDLVQDSVVHALTRFRREALAGRGWRPDGGANLTTYFTGRCMYSFATIYRNHYRGRQQHAAAVDAARRHPQDLSTPDVAEAVADAAAAADLLAAIPNPRLRMILELAAAGHTHAEISLLLADGTTARAVEAMLYRHRVQARKGQQ